MKPLTIEELKALEVGDWVWIVDKEQYCSVYAQKCDLCNIDKNGIHEDVYKYTASRDYYWDYSNYGTKWLAYKNKEQAEAKGDIVELPSIRPIKNKIGELFEVVFIQCSGTVCSETYPDKEQAKARLAELKKE